MDVDVAIPGELIVTNLQFVVYSFIDGLIHVGIIIMPIQESLCADEFLHCSITVLVVKSE